MRISTLVLALALLAPTLHAQSITIPIERREGPWARAYSQNLEPSLTRPAGTWKLPDFRSRQPIYLSINIGGPRLLVLDTSTTVPGPTARYDRMIADLDGDGDLAEEKPIGGKLSTMFVQQCTFKIPFTVNSTRGAEPYPCLLETISFGEAPKSPIDELWVRVIGLSGFRGRTTLDDQPVDFVLIDSNLDGRFDEPLAKFAPESGSKLASLIGTGDHLLVTRGGGGHDFPLGRRLLVANRIFDIAVDTASEKPAITLTPVEGALAPLQVGEGCAEVFLWDEGAGDSILLIDPAARVSIPAGNWKIMEYTVTRVGARNQPWTLSARGTALTSAVTVAEPGAALDLARSLLPRVDWDPEHGILRSRSGAIQEVSLDFVLLGNHGEAITDYHYRKASSGGILGALLGGGGSYAQPLPPTYRIVTAEGEQIAAGRFEYG